MMLMCINGGLDGVKTKNVENIFVFKAFLEVRGAPTNRLTKRLGGVREGRRKERKKERGNDGRGQGGKTERQNEGKN